MAAATRVVGYLRRSTTIQEQSLERQRHEIERYVAEHGLEVVHWYEDDGISGVDDASRPAFQRMMADAETSRNFEQIIVNEISRFGRFDNYQLGAWLHRLKGWGVRVYATAGTIRDPYSMFSKVMLAFEQDRQESVKLSMRTLSGQRETASKGLRAGGKVPYGFARLRRKANGTIENEGRIGRAKRDKSELIELAPGDPVEVEAVRSIFTWAMEGSGYRSIAARLNERGVPSPDVARQKTIATTPGRWVSTTIRAILRNPAYVGDAVWNVRSMPKFHRLERDQIVPLEDPDGREKWRKNDRADWVVRRDAHPALIDRATFEEVQERARSRPAMPRGHRHDYLLTGTLACGCGGVVTGQTRIRKKALATGERVYEDPVYVCGSGLRAKGICRQIGLPCDAFEIAVLRILDEEVLSAEGLTHLERAIRHECALRRTSPRIDRSADLARRERELARQVTDGARRILLVDDAVVAEVKAALDELKAELEVVRNAIEAEKRAITVDLDPDAVIAAMLDPLRSISVVLRDPATPLDRRREFLRRLLPPGPNGERPIRVEFDLKAERGWRNSLRRVTVRHLSVRALDVAKVTKVVAGAGFEPATSGL